MAWRNCRHRPFQWKFVATHGDDSLTTRSEGGGHPGEGVILIDVVAKCIHPSRNFGRAI